MLDVFFTAIDDLDGRRGRVPQPRSPATIRMHLDHLLDTDPASCIVADDHGRVVAFGIVMRRGAEAFLSFLFVVPRWQARGLGRAVLAACLRGAGAFEHLATCAEADQPVSTGLYASLGLAPRTPIYLLRGVVADEVLPVLPEGIQAAPVDIGAASGLDRQLLGYERPGDHAFWAGGERVGWAFLAGDGALLGYGYAHRSGRVGPVAAADPELLPAFVGHLVRSVPVLEGRQLAVPGPAISVLRPLLAAGVRIDGTPAVYCAVGHGPALDRYLPMSFALL